jgi:signal transduction histidine kinase
MRLNHRTRLALVSAGSAGLLFLLIFAVSARKVQSSEMRAGQDELNAALTQVASDVSGGQEPDLKEVVASNPAISLGVFNANGRAVARDGYLQVQNVSRSGLRDGYLYRIGSVKGLKVVAAMSWSHRAALVNRFVVLCLILWFPLVGVVLLATWFAARATFLPLERLAKEAEALSADRLSERLHVDDTGEYREFVLRLNRFLEKIESSVQREERFLSDAAHELRTPLTVLRGEIDTSLRRKRSEGEYRETLQVLLEETNRLSSLVELLLRSADPMQLPSSPIDLASAAEHAHARWADRFADKGVRLHLSVSAATAGLTDSEFDVIVDNLLANSLRVSPSGTVCSISVERAVDGVTFKVSDEGPGVRPADVERIFERFTRCDEGRSRSEGGFGIGLAVCRRIVESRGGTIRFEPGEPAGSVFVVDLRLPA